MPETTHRANIWIFSNNCEGYYDDSDWDMSKILQRRKYYFKENESNRSYVKQGDSVILRTYGYGFWGSCQIDSDWISDPDGKTKYEVETGWFNIKNVKRWKTTLPFEIIKADLSNQNHRLRIARATEEDKRKIELGLNIYIKLGYGSTDGEFFILENGVEEAVKKNLTQLDLKLAEDEIQQQCTLGIGAGRTDLICRDKDGNFVVLELKAVNSSDYVVGQILRYMGFIREHWGTAQKKEVRGIILTPGYDEQLRLAAKEAGIKVLRLSVS